MTPYIITLQKDMYGNITGLDFLKLPTIPTNDKDLAELIYKNISYYELLVNSWEKQGFDGEVIKNARYIIEIAREHNYIDAQVPLFFEKKGLKNVND